jgi:hypothetical protein
MHPGWALKGLEEKERKTEEKGQIDDEATEQPMNR